MTYRVNYRKGTGYVWFSSTISLFSPNFFVGSGYLTEDTYQSAHTYEWVESSKKDMFKERWEHRRGASNLA